MDSSSWTATVKYVDSVNFKFNKMNEKITNLILIKIKKQKTHPEREKYAYKHKFYSYAANAVNAASLYLCKRTKKI